MITSTYLIPLLFQDILIELSPLTLQVVVEYAIYKGCHSISPILFSLLSMLTCAIRFIHETTAITYISSNRKD